MPKRTDSIMQSELECYVCHTTHSLNLHHIYEGYGRRELSDQDGCWCWLCVTHHTSRIGVHFNKKLDLKLKAKCQDRWMRKYNKTEEEFIKRYRRSYKNG